MANKKQNTENSSLVKRNLDLLYMTPSTVSARDIVKLLENKKDIGVSIELWDELNVLEIELPDKSTIDIEPIDIHFPDPSDVAFVKNRSIKTIFAVNLSEENLDTVKEFFNIIISQYSGFLCADTQDFSPVYIGSSKVS
jgi:hypothetical protein